MLPGMKFAMTGRHRQHSRGARYPEVGETGNDGIAALPAWSDALDSPGVVFRASLFE